MTISMPSAAAPPAVRKDTAELIDPAEALSYYATAPAPCPIATCYRLTDTPVEILELANGLGANRLDDAAFTRNVFEFIYNTVTTTPQFGSQKGALGAAIDRHGTAFDQAQLMVELLRQDTTLAPGVSYQIGELTIPSEMAANWLGISYVDGQNETFNQTALQKLLADSGIPASFSGANLTLLHIWVKVGNDIYDPSLKQNTRFESVDLSSLLGCVAGLQTSCGDGARAAVLTNATDAIKSGNVPYLANLNTDALDAKLTQYASALQTNFDPSSHGYRAEKFLGGAEIDRSSLPSGGTLAGSTHSSGAMTFSEIPDSYRLAWHVSIDDVDAGFYADEIYGKRLRILGFVDNSVTPIVRQLGLYLETKLVGSSSLSGATSTNDTILYSVNQPYAASGGQGAIQGTYMDETRQMHTAIQTTNTLGLNVFAQTALVLASGTVTPHLVERYNAYASREKIIPDFENWNLAMGYHQPTGSADSFEVFPFNSSVPTIAADWLAQREMASRLIDGVGNSSFIHHHSFVTLSVGATSDLGVDSANSAISRQANSIDEDAAFATLAVLANRLEGSVHEQLGQRWEGGSSVSRAEKANQSGRQFMDVNSGNVDNALAGTDYSSVAKYEIGQIANADGLSIVLPDSNSIGVFSLPGGSIDLQGASLYAYDLEGDYHSHLVSTRFKGATGNAVPAAEVPEAIEVKSFSINGLEGVSANFVTGDLNVGPVTDISTGGGEFPYGLSFDRTYDSSRFSYRGGYYSGAIGGEWGGFGAITIGTNGARWTIGGGWRHNFGITAKIVSEGYQALGADSILDMAFTLAGTQSLFEMMRAPDFKDRVGSVFVADWIGDKMIDNVVAISGGGLDGIFTLLPDGTYNPPNESGRSLTLTGARAVPILGNFRPVYDYSAISFVHADKFGNDLSFDPGTYIYGTNWSAYTEDFIPVSWNFASGVEIDFEYEVYISSAAQWTGQSYLTRVSNSLGRSLEFSYQLEATFDPGGGTTLPEFNWADLEYFPIDSVKDDNGRIVTYERTYWSDPSAGSTVNYPLSLEVVGVDSLTTTYSYEELLDPDRSLPTSNLSVILRPGDGPASPTASFDYNGTGQLQSVTNAIGDTTLFEFSGGYRSEVTLADDSVQTFGYDEHGNLDLYVDQLGRQTSYEYDDLGRIVEVAFPSGRRETNSYDDRSNLDGGAEFAVPPSTAWRSWSAQYDQLWNQPLWVEDFKGNRTDYTYDPSTGLLTKIEGPEVLGGRPTTTIEYSSCSSNFGRPCSIVDPENMILSLTYGTALEHHELWTETVDGGGLNLTTSYEYDAVGNIETVVSPSQSVTRRKHDQLRRLEWEQFPDPDPLDSENESLVVVNRYDPNGNKIGVDLRKGTSTGDLLSRKETDFDPTGRPSHVFNEECFDAQGIRIQSLDGCGVTSTTYDVLGRPDVITGPSGRKTKTTYLDDGKIEKVIRAWQTAETYANGSSLQQDYQTYTYHDNGLVATVLDANGNLTTYEYDGFDRLFRTIFPRADSSGLGQSNSSDYEQLEYDDNDNILWKRTRAGDWINSSFDALDREEWTRTVRGAKTGPIENHVESVYDLSGRIDYLSQTDGYYIDYEYDSAGRLDFVVDNGRSINYEHDENGNRVRMDYPGADNFYVTYEYDDAGRLVFLREKGAQALASYSYDDQSRRDTLTLGNGRVIDYGYFNDGALDTIEHVGLLGVESAVWSFSYNRSNQVTQKLVPMQFTWDAQGVGVNTYVADGLNRYDSVDGQTLSYDSNSSLVSDGVWTYEYDVNNRLTSASKSGTSVAYEYDPLGRRARKSGTGVVSEVYLNDGVEEIVDYDGLGNILRRYVHGLGVDERVVMYSGTDLSTKEYYHTDHQGTTVAISDNFGDLDLDGAVYTYSAWGEPGAEGLSGNPFRYNGRRLDAETGLYYYRARYYSPTLGRFLQSDPIGYGDNMNLYAYVGNDPMNGIDPTGTETAKTWQEAEKKVANRLRREGHTIVSTQSRGRQVKAYREESVFWRKFDVVSEFNGVTYVTEVKWSANEKRQKSKARRAVRKLDPTRKVSWVPDAYRSGTTIFQLWFDVKLESDMELVGTQFGAGETRSETDGEVVIRWEFWSPKKNEKIVNISLLKRISDPDERKEEADALLEELKYLIKVSQ